MTDSVAADFKVVDAPFVFRGRPEPLPADLRPLWRIAIVVLLLELASRGNKSSFKRLHVLDWLAQRRDNRATLNALLSSEIKPHEIAIRVDPALNRAVDLALGEGLLDILNGNRVHLTAKGKKMASLILATDDMLELEKERIKAVGKGLTETLVNKLLPGA